jgi:hypothetical protein
VVHNAVSVQCFRVRTRVPPLLGDWSCSEGGKPGSKLQILTRDQYDASTTLDLLQRAHQDSQHPLI